MHMWRFFGGRIDAAMNIAAHLNVIILHGIYILYYSFFFTFYVDLYCFSSLYGEPTTYHMTLYFIGSIGRTWFNSNLQKIDVPAIMAWKTPSALLCGFRLDYISLISWFFFPSEFVATNVATMELDVYMRQEEQRLHGPGTPGHFTTFVCTS